MKYIDAELLRKEVKRLEKIAHKSALGCADSETRKFLGGKEFAYQHVGTLIDSLQQEIWKPNEEQIMHLVAAVEESNENPVLDSLYHDLQKLM